MTIDQAMLKSPNNPNLKGQPTMDPDGLERLLESYFAGRRGFVAHQLESVEDFIEHGLREIITNHEPVQVTNGRHRVVLKFGRVTITHPVVREANGDIHPVLPSECVERRLTYANGILADLTQELYLRDPTGDNDDTFTFMGRQEFTEVPIGTLPCFVGSRYCWTSHSATDPLRGYYIVNGQEKVIQSQVKLRSNMIHVFRALKSSQSSVLDATGTRLSEHTYEAEVRSVNESKYKSTSSVVVSASLRADGTTQVIVSIKFLRCDVPLVQILRIFEHLAHVDGAMRLPLFLRTMDRGRPATRAAFEATARDVLHDPQDTTVDDLLQAISDQGASGRTPMERLRSTLRLLRCDVLPHIGTADTPDIWERKWVFFLLLAGRALYAHCLSRTMTGLAIADDRDHWRNKRAEPAGLLIGVLFRQNFAQFMKNAKADIHRRLDGIERIHAFSVLDSLSASKMETSIRHHFSTGKWTVMRGVSPSSCTGVCAPLNRMTHATALSCLTRVNVPVNREGKNPLPRQVHTSDWGNVCVVETPEGQGCGLVLSHCVLTHVRTGVDTAILSRAVVALCDHDPGQGFLDRWADGGILVMVNGSILGAVDDGASLLHRLRDGRRRGALPIHTSLIHVPGVALHVNHDPGVCMRPVIPAAGLERMVDLTQRLRGVPRGGSAVLNGLWDRLIYEGCIEYLDTEEQEQCVVATSVAAYEKDPDRYTHLEVDVNLAMFGVCANTIPYANHNQSPRIVYQSSMGKQAIGARLPGHDHRYDCNLYELHYPQRPISRTRYDELMGMGMDFPASQEAVVMVLSSGNNQEDSIILNAASEQRGFGHSTVYKTYMDEIHPREGDHVSEGAFDKRMANYAHLGADGIVEEGTVIRAGDVLIRKTAQNLELAPDGSYVPIRRDRSIVAKEDGVVDKVVVTLNREGNTLVRVRLRVHHKPIVGDKFAAKHAQKGTVGLLVPPENLPVSFTGMVPDIIINPHGFVSRMTMGMFYEMLVGKAGCFSGTRADATPFQDRTLTMEGVYEVLKAAGFDAMGNERFIDGESGRMIEAPIFMGVCSYQVLRHLAAEKLNSRARGPRNLMTNQPLDGKSRGGGLRTGEMELACCMAHASTEVICDRMAISSDAETVHICTQCGLIAEPAHNAHFSQGIRGKEAFCRACRTSRCVPKSIPTASRLFMQELQCFHVGTRLY
jgi:DNA-directed RNA polymerase II subunit RPB2